LSLATEQELKQLDKEAKAEVDAAVDESKASPEPELKDLRTDISIRALICRRWEAPKGT